MSRALPALSLRPRTRRELAEKVMRTVAMMRELRRRCGSTTVHHFSRMFDEKAGTDTSGQKKWYPFDRGDKPIPIGALRELCRVFPDASLVYSEGPHQIWTALWGDPSELSLLMSQHPMASHKQRLADTIRRIEMDAVVGVESFSGIVRIVALYRFLSITDPYGRWADGNGFGMAYTIYSHLMGREGLFLDPMYQVDFEHLGVLDKIKLQLFESEKRRCSLRPSWVSSNECGVLNDDEIETIRRQRESFRQRMKNSKSPTVKSNDLSKLVPLSCIPQHRNDRELASP